MHNSQYELNMATFDFFRYDIAVKNTNNDIIYTVILTIKEFNLNQEVIDDLIINDIHKTISSEKLRKKDAPYNFRLEPDIMSPDNNFKENMSWLSKDQEVIVTGKYNDKQFTATFSKYNEKTIKT